MQITLQTNSPTPWAAFISGRNNNYQWQRTFCQRVRNAVHGTGITRFTLPDVSGFVEVCFGRKDSRRYYEIRSAFTDPTGYEPFNSPAECREVKEPWGEPLGGWRPLDGIMKPPAPVVMEDWD